MLENIAVSEAAAGSTLASQYCLSDRVTSQQMLWRQRRSAAAWSDGNHPGWCHRITAQFHPGPITSPHSSVLAPRLGGMLCCSASPGSASPDSASPSVREQCRLQGRAPAVGCGWLRGNMALRRPLRGFLADLGWIWCQAAPALGPPLSTAPRGASQRGAVEPPAAALHPERSLHPLQGSKHVRGVAFVFSKLHVPQSCESQPALWFWSRFLALLLHGNVGKCSKNKKRSTKIKAKLLLIFNLVVFEAGL